LPDNRIVHIDRSIRMVPRNTAICPSGSIPDQADIERNIEMIKRALMISVAAAVLIASAGAAGAQDVLKLGLVQSMTGALNTTGKAVVNGALLHRRMNDSIERPF
jgi:hypothetical protein